jgi:hypothetical protein
VSLGAAGAFLLATVLSLRVTPETQQNAELQVSLARVLEMTDAIVLLGREAEATCSSGCVRVVVQTRPQGILLSARRGAQGPRATLEVSGAGDGFDRVHALALQIRGLIEQLPPPVPFPSVRRDPQPPAPVEDAAPRPPEPALPIPPGVPTEKLSPSLQTVQEGTPPQPPSPAVVAPVPAEARKHAFAFGLGGIALFSQDADFRMQGLLLTVRFPVFGSLEGRFSAGILPDRLRTGAAGRYTVHVLPVTFGVSAPLFVAPLRLGLGFQAVNASVTYTSTELDSASAWTIGPVVQMEARLPVGSFMTILLGAGLAYLPFREQVETGNALVFAYPRWSALATAALELNLYR